MGPKLAPGEQVTFEGHPSWRSIIGFYLKGLLTVLLVAFVVGVITNIVDDETNAGLVALVAVIGVALVVLAGFIKRIFTSYTITNRRLHIRRGIIAREIQETRLERVQNVNYDQSVLDRVLRVGTVDFDTAGTDDSEFRFEWVNGPDVVVRAVDEAIAESEHRGLQGARPQAGDRQAGL